MFKNPVFLFEDGSADNNGGGGDSQNQGTENSAAIDNADKIVDDAGADNISSKQELPDDIKAQLAELAELRAYKESTTAKIEKTPEQIAKEQEQDRADFIKFSVENDLMKIDDLTKYETVKVKADADLVFENFISQFKEDNPEITDEAELSAAAKEEFDATYKISSENEKAKQRGLAKLAKDAADIRNPVETTYKKAEQSYKEEKEIKAKMPEFQKFVDSVIEKKATDKVLVFKEKEGEEDIAIEIELTKEDKEAISKAFKTHKTFYQFNKNKPEDVEASLSKKIEGWIEVNKAKEIRSKIAETYKGIGLKQGSNVGANNSFALQEQARRAAPVVDMEANNRANAAREQYRTR